MKKLTGLNWKQFFVNHFEKVLFGLVVFGGLVAVATSRWSPYDAKNPNALITSVQEAKEQHKISVWPDVEKEKYADVTDISAKAEKLLAQLPVQEFAFSASLPGMYSPVINNQQPIGDIDWLPVEQMIADAGRVLISTTPKYDPSTMLPGEGLVDGAMPGGMSPGGQGPGQRGAGTEEERNPFAPRGGGGGGLGMGMGTDGMYGPGGVPGVGLGAPGMEPGGRGGRNQPPGAAAPGAMPPGAMPPGMEGMGMGLAMGVAQEGEGKRFVSVRGVFPLKRQEEVLAEALNLRTTAQATQHLNFLDYELQRQAAQPGPNPWSGPWEPVDVSIAMDTMKKSIGTEAVVFDQSIMSQVFTMPLPARLMGYWTEAIASHPALTSFSKTDLAEQQEKWLQQKLAEYKQQMKEFEETNIQKGGWSEFQVSPMQIGMGMMDDPGAMRGLQADFNETFAGAGGGRNGGRMGQDALKTQMEQLITASGAYLLFRYLDFDVEPGHAYRYRVRLKVANPAYGADLTQVERADIAEGPTRWTDWSEPTPVSIVPKDSHHFLAAIDPGGKRQPMRAVFEMFQWMEDTGTMVNQNVTIPLGSAIGGQHETTVIDPAAQTAEPTNVDFKSGDVLVDIATGLNAGAGRTVQTASGATYEIPDRIVLVNDWGGLEIGNKYAKTQTKEQLSEKYQLFTEAYEYLTEPEPEEGMLPGEAGMLSGEGMMLEEEGRNGRRGRRGGP